MKLGAAIEESKRLNKRLELLDSRLARYYEVDGSRDLCDEKISSAANRLRDLRVAINWTELNTLIVDLPILAYRIRAETHQRLANIYEEINSEEADKFQELADIDFRLIEKAIWLVDLQVPTFSSDESEEDGV